MRRNRTFIYNTLLLTFTAILMRVIGLLFQVFLSNKIGAAGIGLFQLIMSVGVFAQTVAISGIRFTTTRLVSEELGKDNPGGAKKAVRRCLCYAGCSGLMASVGLYFLAGYLGYNVIGDGRTVLSLKILSISLPWMAMGTVFAGYFTAVCRVLKSAFVQIFEQFVRIITVVVALSFAKPGNLEEMCAAVVAGGITGETLSFFLIFAIYAIDIRRYKKHKMQGEKITRRMFSIAVPLALSAYARTALVAVQNILIPRGLRKSGSSAESALSSYGTIQGMVFPIITFPSAFFASLSELVVPELTDAQVRGQKEYISKMSNRLLRMCLLFSVGVMAVLLEFSEELGESIYSSSDVGAMIKIFAALMPIMYMDTVTDGMLRGLGQHMYSMYFNIADSALCLVLVVFLLPKYAVWGYIAILYISEIFNFGLSIGRLSKITRLYFEPDIIIKAVIASCGGVSFARLILNVANINSVSAWGLFIGIGVSLMVYVAILELLQTLPREDRDWISGMVGGRRK